MTYSHPVQWATTCTVAVVSVFSHSQQSLYSRLRIMQCCSIHTSTNPHLGLRQTFDISTVSHHLPSFIQNNLYLKAGLPGSLSSSSHVRCRPCPRVRTANYFAHASPHQFQSFGRDFSLKLFIIMIIIIIMHCRNITQEIAPRTGKPHPLPIPVSLRSAYHTAVQILPRSLQHAHKGLLYCKPGYPFCAAPSL